MAQLLWLALACRGTEATDSPPGDSDSASTFLSLADGETGLGLGVGALLLRDAADRWRFGLNADDELCPGADGSSWTGGCIAAGGAAFTGRLDQEGGTWTGAGWRVEGGPDFAALALDGTWTTEGDRESGQRSSLDGAMLVLSGAPEDPRDRFLGQGVEGTLVFEGAWAEDLDVHTVEATLTLPGGVPLTVSLRLEQHPGACSSNLPDAGSLLVESGPERAEYTIAGEAACAGCWSWRHNGVEAGEVCF